MKKYFLLQLAYNMVILFVFIIVLPILLGNSQTVITVPVIGFAFCICLLVAVFKTWCKYRRKLVH